MRVLIADDSSLLRERAQAGDECAFAGIAFTTEMGIKELSP
jgi:hypothetical protein